MTEFCMDVPSLIPALRLSSVCARQWAVVSWVAEAVAEITGGQTRPKITLRDYKCIALALPPMMEQRHIVANPEPLKMLVEHETNKLDRLIALKSALMSDLLSGRKRVTGALPMAAE